MDKLTYAQQLQANRERYYRVAYTYVKNEQDALDIIGEATYKGLRELHTLRKEEYFNTWMMRIVINAAIDFIRKNARHITCGDEVWELIPAEETGLSPDEALDLYEAMDALSGRDKACVILRFFEEYSFPQIADILREPEPTCKSRLYRALKKMRGHLEKGAEA